MKKKFILLFALLNMFPWRGAFAQEIIFSKETFVGGEMSLPYRKASIQGEGDKASLVIYLHGGSSKGDDNETQMQEPGINDIGRWLVANRRKAVMVVPQCPKDKSWLGVTQNTIVAMLQTFIDRGVADTGKVYIFGGSMGGTGTWNMLSNHPDFFAAAMPVAGNPTGLDAEAVSHTPLFTVMGTADNLMKISNVEVFLKNMDAYNAEYQFNVEDGWTHEDVCKKSYTTERLDWVFSHAKDDVSGISAMAGDAGRVVSVSWYLPDGQKLNTEPHLRGFYIKSLTYTDGKTFVRKIYRP